MTESETRRHVNRPYLRGVLTGITASFITYTLFLSPNDAQPVTPQEAIPADSVPNNCPKQDIVTTPESTNPVTEFAIDDLSLEMYTSLLSQAQSFEEAQGFLNQVFNKWDYSIHIAEVPTLSSQDFDTRGNDIEHTPDLITQELVNISSIHILQSLRVIPEPIMAMTRGTKLYLTMGTILESGGFAGLYNKDENGIPTMVVGIGPADPSGDIFEHELAHNLFFRLCGDNIGYNDDELASLNPSDFHYTRADVLDDYWYNITASRYGATNTAEDIADAFPRLFTEGLGYLCIRGNTGTSYTTPLCNKRRLLLERIAAQSPETATYLARS